MTKSNELAGIEGNNYSSQAIPQPVQRMALWLQFSAVMGAVVCSAGAYGLLLEVFQGRKVVGILDTLIVAALVGILVLMRRGWLGNKRWAYYGLKVIHFPSTLIDWLDHGRHPDWVMSILNDPETCAWFNLDV